MPLWPYLHFPMDTLEVRCLVAQLILCSSSHDVRPNRGGFSWKGSRRHDDGDNIPTFHFWLFQTFFLNFGIFISVHFALLLLYLITGSIGVHFWAGSKILHKNNSHKMNEISIGCYSSSRRWHLLFSAWNLLLFGYIFFIFLFWCCFPFSWRLMNAIALVLALALALLALLLTRSLTWLRLLSSSWMIARLTVRKVSLLNVKCFL